MLVIAVVADQPDSRDETGDDADRECAPAEAETIDPVVLRVVAATERIDVDDVALQPEAEDAAENGERLERRGADTVVIIGDLLLGIPEIERLIEAPDIGLEDFRRTVSRSIRQQDDVLDRHGRPIRYAVVLRWLEI